MSNPYFQSLLIFGMIGAIAFFAYDVTKWKSLGSLISRTTKALRVLLLVLVEGMLAALILGPWYMMHHAPALQLSYWSVVIALMLGILVVSLADVIEVIHGYRKINKDMFNSLRKNKDNK